MGFAEAARAPPLAFFCVASRPVWLQFRHAPRSNREPVSRATTNRGMLETYTARIAAPYAVLGVRSEGEWLTGIDYLPVGAPTLAPLDAFAREVCRQLSAYLDDPDFRFDLPDPHRRHRVPGARLGMHTIDPARADPQLSRGGPRARLGAASRRDRLWRQSHPAARSLSPGGGLRGHRRVHAQPWRARHRGSSAGCCGTRASKACSESGPAVIEGLA